ncbi:MAG: hypothetical protein EBU90_17610 [Proteobacteria bacterium]|nr:hypothetical protein [Pseudomonadota bacterium]
MPKIDSILISQPRSGTHFLTSILRNNNLNWAKDEPVYYFLEQNYDYYNKNIKLDSEVAAFFSYYLNKKLPGFKNITGFSSHIYDISAIQGIEYFYKKNNDLKIIVLTRKNLLKRYVSRKIARLTKNYSNTNSSAMVHLTSDEIKTNIDKTKKEQKETLDLLDTLDTQYTQITYEDLHFSPQTVLSQVEAFLKTSLKYLPSTKKQENRSLANIITNYDQLKKELNGTDYIQYFDK